MKRLPLITLLLCVATLTLCSCSSSKGLVESLSKHSLSLDYKYNREIVKCERDVKIALGAVRIDSFSVLTKVSKIERSVYPFIFFNSISEKFWVNLGQNSLEQSFSDFFTDSFFEESDRIGCYTIVDDPKDADYVIDLILKDCQTESVYQTKNQILFLICFYMASSQEYVFPARTSMEIQVRLIGHSGRSEKTYALTKEMPWHGNYYKNIKDLHYNFMANMAKSLSMTTKECIEMIIKDINLTVRYKQKE